MASSKNVEFFSYQMPDTDVNGESIKCYIDQLSDDIILFIFKYLKDRKDLYNIRFINKRLSAIAQDKTLARYVDCRRLYHYTTVMLEDILRPSTQYVEHLYLDNCYWLKPADILLQCTHLRSMHIMQIHVSANLLCQILSVQTRLTSLSVSLYDIHDFHVQLAASPGAQETLRGVVKLKLHFSNRLYYGYTPDINFTTGPSLFDYCRDVEEIHICGNMSTSRAITQNIVQPEVSEVENFKNVKVMTLSTAWDSTARLFFFEIMKSVCKSAGRFTTLLQPSDSENKYWAADSYTFTMTDMSDLLHLDVSGSGMNIPNHVMNIWTAINLTYLNLADNTRVGSDDLVYVASNCPNLTSVNLENCIYLHLNRPPMEFLATRISDMELLPYENEEFSIAGVQTLIDKCMKLRSLNLNGVHFHPKQMVSSSFKNLASLLCMNTNWESLSVSSCSMYTEHTCSSAPKETTQDSQVKITCRKCQLANTKPFDPMSLLKYEPENDLQRLIRLNPDMEQFELISPDFTSSFNKKYGIQPSSYTLNSSTDSFHLEESDLIDIYYWKKLKSLQLTAVEGIKLGYCLWAIANGCPSLERLYLSCIGQLNSCTYMNLLIGSLPLFSKLRDFRLEQPQLAVNTTLMRAIGRCSSLERICIISLRGTFSTEGVKQLFDSLPNLISFQLYTGDPVKKCKQLKDYLLDKYQKSRPALSVCIYPLLKYKLQQVITRLVPEHYIDEMAILKSRVAIRPTEI